MILTKTNFVIIITIIILLLQSMAQKPILYRFFELFVVNKNANTSIIS